MTNPVMLELQQVLEKEGDKLKRDPKYTKYIEYIQELNRLGFLKKQEYTIPPLDTIGRKYYTSLISHSFLSKPFDKEAAVVLPFHQLSSSFT
ncbi:MAG: hypothetical protein EPO28_10980 [Saprospiraceae bacterium]|nr:MAG: hypothetical protein EPO28_10980 [Saprospiraceae bacterium]